MNEPYDPIEAELEALRPRGVSAELGRRIAERLSVTHMERQRWPWGPALAGALAAACLAAVLLGWRGRDSEPSKNGGQPYAPIAVNGNAKPTVLVYHRALAQSSGALDLLLDKHAARTFPPESQRATMRAFTRSDEQYVSLGEEL
jgi:hypothetical protein